jgi:uncharacterized protein involved in exopolysaccharide biosynthesis
MHEALRQDEDEISLIDLAIVVGENRRMLFGCSLLAGMVALAASYAIAPTFTSKTVFMPPQQQQSVAASALQSLGSLAGLASGGGIKAPGDQYVALMRSVTVSNRVIHAFSLKDVYEAKTMEDTRRELASNVRIELGKRDGLVTVEVSDTSPQRAAGIANQYVDELRRISGELAMTEAQQRRVFFEKQLGQAKIKLTAAQLALQNTGVNARTLRVEPKAAAEGYASLRAQVTATEVRLQAIRGSLTNEAPEVKMGLSQLAALRAQLIRSEMADVSGGNDAYVNAYREYKYQENLFDLFSRQYELAKLDESRESALIQVVDAATPPESKAKPRRGFIAVMTTMVTGLAGLVFVLARHSWLIALQGRRQNLRPIESNGVLNE